MTFLHKLAHRLGRLKHRAVIYAAVTLGAAVVSCERPEAVTDSGVAIARVVVWPKTVTLQPNQVTDFVAVGMTPAGDTMLVPVTWSVTGGSITDSAASDGEHYGQYKAAADTGRFKVVATHQPTGKSDTATAVVTAAVVPVASVTVSPASASVYVGLTLQIAATPRDANGNPLGGRTISWASSATSVATVSDSGVVTGVAAGAATITATSEGKSGRSAVTVATLPPPPTGSCLTQAGPLITLSGLRTSAYETSSLASSTKINATTAQIMVDDQSVNVAVRVGGGSNICWAGGEILGQLPPSTAWDIMHDHYGMIPVSHSSANAFQVENLTVFDKGDGISFDSQPDSGWTIRNVHVKYSRDDCVENDYLNSGMIDSSLFDGCFDFVSSQEYGPPVLDGSNNLVTISNSLFRLQAMDGPYSGTPPNHEGFWKWSMIAPKLALYNNVFRADEPSVYNDPYNMNMAPPPGKLVDCANNVVVWLGSGPFPGTLPSTFNGKPCFTVMTGAAGLQYWNNAVAQWKAAHPNPLPDVAPPIVSLFSPGVLGSTTLTGTVTLIATAVDDRDLAGVQFRLNGQNIGSELTAESSPTKYVLSWDSHALANGSYTLTAIARDAAGHVTTSAGVAVTISN